MAFISTRSMTLLVCFCWQFPLIITAIIKWRAMNYCCCKYKQCHELQIMGNYCKIQKLPSHIETSTSWHVEHYLFKNRCNRLISNWLSTNFSINWIDCYNEHAVALATIFIFMHSFPVWIELCSHLFLLFHFNCLFPNRFGSSSSQASQNSGDICRICHCESDPQNPLLTPCYCSGSLKYVHQTCLQQWLTASETNSCELCKFPFIMHTKIKPFNEVSFFHSFFHKFVKSFPAH